ncbi:hypothetical protein DFH27DRAFT_47306 [Peziza echinospora]|nr:hypothetical protein DFH27DRAFT_47306 [Peziza echinospora]
MSANFNPYRCVTLHNQIVALSVLGQPTSTYTIAPFFDAYPDLEEHYDNVPDEPPLVFFLERILVVRGVGDNANSTIGFTPELGMPHPATFWMFSDELSEFDEERDEDGAYFGENMGERPLRKDGHLGNSILLYPQSASSPMNNGGLYFDITTHRCRIVDSLLDCTDDFPEENWLPLEKILERYLQLFQIGKFHSNPEIWPVIKSEFYVDDDLSKTLEAYEILVEEIQQRRDAMDECIVNGEPQGMIDEATLDRWRIKGFAKEFLMRARPPPFKYLAPGITHLTPELLNTLMQHDIEESGESLRQRSIVDIDGSDVLVPNLLFPSDTDVEERAGEFALDGFLVGNRAGVYLSPSFQYGDTITFINSWPVHGHRPDGSNDCLFQHGRYCPYFSSHNARLVTLLQKWACMVRCGIFGVGADGVLGGMRYWGRQWASDPDLLDVGRCWGPDGGLGSESPDY